MKDKNNTEKPTNENEFKNWLKLTLGYEINNNYKFYYDTVVKQLKTDFEQSEYWKKILKEFSGINDKYFIKKGVHLLIPSNTPTIYTKSLDSLVTKAYRKNVLNNDNFPNPPEEGWIRKIGLNQLMIL